MNEVLDKIHSVIDQNVEDPFLFLHMERPEEAYGKLKYFAADVIAQNYEGRCLDGLACVCQCFFNSRMAHTQHKDPDALHVLLGDFYIGQMAGFELPEETSFEIMEQFAAFIEAETADLETEVSEDIVVKQAKLPETEDIDLPDLEKFEALFRKIAEVAHE